MRDPQGTIRLYTKGADSVILERLQRRGHNESLTERALDVSPTAAWGGCTALLLLALGWVCCSECPAALPPSALGVLVLPSALGTSAACGTGGGRTWNPPLVLCMEQLRPGMLMGML